MVEQRDELSRRIDDFRDAVREWERQNTGRRACNGPVGEWALIELARWLEGDLPKEWMEPVLLAAIEGAPWSKFVALADDRTLGFAWTLHLLLCNLLPASVIEGRDRRRPGERVPMLPYLAEYLAQARRRQAGEAVAE